MYISITECGLTEAQKFIKALATELQAANPENFAENNEETSSRCSLLSCTRDEPSAPVRRSLHPPKSRETSEGHSRDAYYCTPSPTLLNPSGNA